jgi:eukaryotic-like serine/threonine-protein kinase
MTQLGKFDILKEIGRGGFGVVYKARDRGLGRLVALKVLHPQLTVDPKFINNFKREAQNLAKIEHSNVVSIHEICEVEGRLIIVMPYLSGGSLAEKILEGPMDLKESLKIIRDVAAGLDAGHRESIIHRDVKPENILFDAEGQAIVTDFGVALVLNLSSIGTSTHTEGAIGTPYYRPPELWRGTPPPSPATDVYSLACVFFEMLTGEVLFQGDTPDQLITKHLVEDVHEMMATCQAQLPDRIKAVLVKALSKAPEERFNSINDFMMALSARRVSREALNEPDGSAREEKALEGIPLAVPRKIPLWAYGVGGGIVVLVILGLVINLIGWWSSMAIEEPTPTSTIAPSRKLTPGIYSTMINEVDHAEMVYVSEGPFTMGSSVKDIEWILAQDWCSDCNNLWFENERPVHEVYLNGFWIYKHEVTNAQYLSCIDAGVCEGDPGDYPKDNYPAVYINWYEAESYCNWAGCQLPSEAEWEKAARGADGQQFPWGNTAPSCNLAAFKDCSEMVLPVGSFPEGASPYGALDMAGNVWEWVADWYDAEYYQNTQSRNPQGPGDTGIKAFRGGSWLTHERFLRASNRSAGPRYITNDFDIGFRCVHREVP